MSPFLAQFRKEVFALMVSPSIYLLLGVWYLLNGLVFVYLLDYSPAVQADLALLPQFLFGSGLLVWLLLPAFPPLLTLRLLAEEHRLGTLEPLLSAPVSDVGVVAAKYLGASVFFLLFWGGVLCLFLFLGLTGAELDWAKVLGGFLGAFLCSLLFLATGMFASSWSGNLVLAAGGGAVLNYMLLFVPVIFEQSPGALGVAAKAANIPNMLDRGFAAGLVDSYALVFFLGLSLLFLFLTWVRLVSRRWVP